MRASVVLLMIIVALSRGNAQTPTETDREVTRQLIAARDSVWRAWFANDTVILRRMLPDALVAGGGRPIHWNDLPAELAESRSFASSGARLERITFTGTRITIDGAVAMAGSDYELLIRSPQRVDSVRGHAVELFVRQGAHWVNPFWLLGSTNNKPGQ